MPFAPDYIQRRKLIKLKADEFADSVDPDEVARMSRLIWI